MPQPVQSASGPQQPIRCFVVGCPRSGTTLLTSIISGHPKLVGTLFEAHFFSIWRALRRNQDPASKCVLFDQFRASMNDAALGAPGDPIPEPNEFIAAMDEIALRKNMLGWVEKTPENLHHIDAILAVAPDAKFIHVVRNAGAVLASGISRSIRDQSCTWNPAYTRFRSAFNEWMRAMEQTRRWQSHPNHLVVEYAEFCRAPDTEIERIGQFLGLETSEEMLTSAVAPSGLREQLKEEHARGFGVRTEQWDQFKRVFPGLKGPVVRLLSFGGAPKWWLRMPILSRGQDFLLRQRGGALDRWLTPEIEIAPADPA